MFGGKILAVVIIGGLILALLGRWFWIALVVIAALFIIRLLADVFWWGKDKGKW